MTLPFSVTVKDAMSDNRPDSQMLCRFPTTQWSRVVTASSRDALEAREALSGLCGAYWYPIYAYIRHRRYTAEQARDLTQDFFAYVLERDMFAKADPARGRFRAFLRTVCARQLAARRDHENAAKRGGGRSMVSIDPCDAERRYTLEPAHGMTPERIFDRTWALTLLERVVDRLRCEYDDAGRSANFEELIAQLTRDPSSGAYSEIAGRLGTTEGNVRVAVHRLRRRYGLLLREEIAATVHDAAQVEDEIRTLFAALEG
jgi:DNA-directed RNA polymerase specialized sigma24 family protein